MGVFEKAAATGGGAESASHAVLPLGRALHRYMRLVLAVHSGLAWKLSPALKKCLFRWRFFEARLGNVAWLLRFYTLTH